MKIERTETELIEEIKGHKRWETKEDNTDFWWKTRGKPQPLLFSHIQNSDGRQTFTQHHLESIQGRVGGEIRGKKMINNSAFSRDVLCSPCSAQVFFLLSPEHRSHCCSFTSSSLTGVTAYVNSRGQGLCTWSLRECRPHDPPLDTGSMSASDVLLLSLLWPLKLDDGLAKSCWEFFFVPWVLSESRFTVRERLAFRWHATGPLAFMTDVSCNSIYAG